MPCHIMQALPSFFFIRGFPHSPHLRKATPEPNMSSRKSRPSCNHLPTGTLGKVGVIRTANPKKSALGPSNDDNQSRPDDVSTKAGVKIQLKTAEDEGPTRSPSSDPRARRASRAPTTSSIERDSRYGPRLRRPRMTQNRSTNLRLTNPSLLYQRSCRLDRRHLPGPVTLPRTSRV